MISINCVLCLNLDVDSLCNNQLFLSTATMDNSGCNPQQQSGNNYYTSLLFSYTHPSPCVESSLYYGLGFLSGVISTVIIVLVCVVTIAIIYHTLVKGEVCVCVTGVVLSLV